jgi:hypothetical protein
MKSPDATDRPAFRPMTVYVVIWSDEPPEAFLARSHALARIAEALDIDRHDVETRLAEHGVVTPGRVHCDDQREDAIELYTCKVQP